MEENKGFFSRVLGQRNKLIHRTCQHATQNSKEVRDLWYMINSLQDRIKKLEEKKK